MDEHEVEFEVRLSWSPDARQRDDLLAALNRMHGYGDGTVPLKATPTEAHLKATRTLLRPREGGEVSVPATVYLKPSGEFGLRPSRAEEVLAGLMRAQAADRAALAFALDLVRLRCPGGEGLTDAELLLARVVFCDGMSAFVALVGEVDGALQRRQEFPSAPSSGQMWLARDLGDVHNVHGAIVVVRDSEVNESDKSQVDVSFVTPNAYDLSGDRWATMTVPESHARRLRGMSYRYVGEVPDECRSALGL